MLAAKNNNARAIEVLAKHGANLTKAVYEPEDRLVHGTASYGRLCGRWAFGGAGQCGR